MNHATCLVSKRGRRARLDCKFDFVAHRSLAINKGKNACERATFASVARSHAWVVDNVRFFLSSRLAQIHLEVAEPNVTFAVIKASVVEL